MWSHKKNSTEYSKYKHVWQILSDNTEKKKKKENNNDLPWKSEQFTKQNIFSSVIHCLCNALAEPSLFSVTEC